MGAGHVAELGGASLARDEALTSVPDILCPGHMFKDQFNDNTIRSRNSCFTVR